MLVLLYDVMEEDKDFPMNHSTPLTEIITIRYREIAMLISTY